MRTKTEIQNDLAKEFCVGSKVIVRCDAEEQEIIVSSILGNFESGIAGMTCEDFEEVVRYREWFFGLFAELATVEGAKS